MNLTFMVPTVVCLCVAVVQAMRGHWKNMVIAILTGIIFFQFAGFILQSHANANLRAWNHALKARVTGMERRMENLESNKVSETPQPAPGAASATPQR